MFRIGQSSDIHQFCKGSYITLGGETIAFNKGLLAHSDGDALCHAIGEAILGALALGDLGHHFPDTDDAYKGMSSLLILEQVYQLMDTKGYEVNNVDSLIMIEKPAMAPHIEKMRENIAKVLHCDITQVSVKATRGEKIGFVGREEGVLAQCVVLLKKK
ncbi:MAG: 2-C-methyl-D-erythritol 2,4-cyclodiphosphate synthase [Erysipelotrichia bacterium]|nr:2-C-methyl-D-erythritol 2,4-cyclodiphosphate synthase [Erysipelotrichia bacterium]NCC54005.1 2-C-methyl-D-erythritol 2,4-cyclodiphosphate synthase [Erysipelotrichia bacterium]